MEITDKEPERSGDPGTDRGSTFQNKGMVWMDKGWRKEFWKKLIAVSLVLLAGYGYYLANLFNSIRFTTVKPFIFEFPIDQWIPFNRFFILPYYYWYFYIVFTILMLFFQKDSRNYYRLVFSMSLCVMIACVIFVVFPTCVPRAELVGNDFLTGLVRQIQAIDPPYNCFPSMHVLYAFTCSWYLLAFKRIGWWFDAFVGVSFVMISLSTVFTKQHYTPDILGGIAVAGAVCCLFTFVWTDKKRSV